MAQLNSRQLPSHPVFSTVSSPFLLLSRFRCDTCSDNRTTINFPAYLFLLSFHSNFVTLRNTCFVNAAAFPIQKWIKTITHQKPQHGQRYSIGVKWKEKPKIESVSMGNSLPFTAPYSTLCDFRFSVRLVRFVSFEFVLCCLESCFSPFMNFLAKCFECGVGGGNAALRKTMPHHRLTFIFRMRRDAELCHHNAEWNMKNTQNVYE